ncbi:MAG: arylsulfatase, partial [Armatimonadetes bacterium]|nr:arylsulfatase [Armatimonadota bacterium]
MRRALLAALGLLSALLVPAAGGPVPPAALRPNVVLILGDDIGYSDYGSYGGEIRTPNLDRLALEGMRFTRFYNNSVCVPTRASLLTGLYPRYVGRDARIQLTERMVTLGELLQDAGYQTALSGKWHLGREEPHRPRDRGFQEYFGLLDGCSNCFNPNRPDPPFEGGRVRHWSRNEQRITEFPRDFYATDAITDHAVAQIRRMAASGKPFFSHVCYTAAHSPLHARPRDIARYRGRYRAGWDTLRAERHARQRALGIVEPGWRLPAREPEVLPWDEE